MTDPKGFTLIELLVVLGVISLLISLLLPALQAARRSARAVACMSNQRQIGMAIQMYVNDSGGWLPLAYYAGPNDGSNMPYIYTHPALLITEGLKPSSGVYRCPEDSNVIEDNCLPRDVGGVIQGAYSYCYNQYLGGNAPLIWVPRSYPPYQPRKVSRITKIWTLVLLADANVPRNWLWFDSPGNSLIAYGRHPGGTVNVLLGDYHVQAVTYSEALTLKWVPDFTW